jgi:hypothetical protein
MEKKGIKDWRNFMVERKRRDQAKEKEIMVQNRELNMMPNHPENLNMFKKKSSPKKEGLSLKKNKGPGRPPIPQESPVKQEFEDIDLNANFDEIEDDEYDRFNP